MRLLKHPGRPLPPRRLAIAAECAGEWRVTLPPGADLRAALTGALAARSVAQAAVQLVAGDFETLCCDAGVSSELEPAPRRFEGPLTLIGGNAVLGREQDGEPRLHCQLLALDAGGRLCGGRLAEARLGVEGLVAQVVALRGGGFRARADEETQVTLFEPVGEEP